MALDWQALAAKKAWKAFETCEALEQVAARMKRVMGLTHKLSRRLTAQQFAGRLECLVRHLRIFVQVLLQEPTLPTQA